MSERESHAASVQERISALVERAPNITVERFAEFALPLLMEANEALAAATASDGSAAYEYDARVGIGYTLATGRLYCPMDEFHAFAEKLLGRPILTHEFADSLVWAELRDAFTADAEEALGDERV